ncbi:MAG: hypothetical protein PW843_29495 [Azospirillaceae bacterium]|nr:hypothetical protein [Azospirillaceae bacterium]
MSLDMLMGKLPGRLRQAMELAATCCAGGEAGTLLLAHIDWLVLRLALMKKAPEGGPIRGF